MWNTPGKMGELKDLSRHCSPRQGACYTTLTCPSIIGVKPYFTLLISRIEALHRAFRDYLHFNFAPAHHKTILNFVFSAALLKYIYALLIALTLSSAFVVNTEPSSE
jgi:hypothetical protein